jgi:hypothetical protein
LPLGRELNFSGYPVELFYDITSDDYFIKCKDVYLSYRLFNIWKTNISKNKVAYNEKGDWCKITQRNHLTKIGCLTTETNTFFKLVFKLEKTIKDDDKNKKTECKNGKENFRKKLNGTKEESRPRLC